MSLTIAALVKQIPVFEAMTLGADGRLVRDGLELEMNAYCRRAVAQAVDLAAEHDGSVCVLTLGPPPAEDVLREAIAWGLDHGVETTGVLVTDPAFAGSDTLATARALAAALRAAGPFDLVLAGRNSVDADTGQVGPELAELLDLPFATGVRHLALDGRTLDLRCEHDDGWVQARIELPALLSTAERLIDPCKVEPAGRAAVAADRIRVMTAADLGDGPWGQAASPTRVGPVRVIESERLRHRIADAPLDEQVRQAFEILAARGALDPALDHATDLGIVPAAPTAATPTRTIGVLVEPDRAAMTRELLGGAAGLGGHVVALTVDEIASGGLDQLGSWGADEVVRFVSPASSGGAMPEEDVAAGTIEWVRESGPWAVLAPSTAWGREVASRVAAAVGAGLTGDAVGFELDGVRLTAWKPAFGGQLVAAIHADSATQMATVRAGMLAELQPRVHRAVMSERPITSRGRVHVLARTRDDDLDLLAEATAVIGVGQGVAPEDYPRLQQLSDALGAEIAATRKVTDRGWLPRARQVGITGRSIAPRLFVSIGASGKFNHMVGVRAARLVLAINTDPEALVFDVADVGIVGDWREVVPLLLAEIHAAALPTRR
jgi:electron transfer flavoprotein alpha subunit/electron transfer flavoprotein alpha/beta subunit